MNPWAATCHPWRGAANPSAGLPEFKPAFGQRGLTGRLRSRSGRSSERLASRIVITYKRCILSQATHFDCNLQIKGQANREVARLAGVDPIAPVRTAHVLFHWVVEVQPHRHVLRGLVVGQQIHGGRRAVEKPVPASPGGLHR